MSRVCNGVDDVAIQQLPAKPTGNGLRNAAAAASELPVDSQYTVIHFSPPVTDSH
jgi:hypothetical protein